MKKSILLAAASFAAACSFTSAAHAQSISIGIKGGVNASRLAGNVTNKDYYSTKYGGQGGLLLNVSFLNNGILAVQPEVLFSQRGYKVNDPSTKISGSNSIYTLKGTSSYNYIDVPLLAKVKLGSFYFEAGPQYSHLLSAKDDNRYLQNGNLAHHETNELNLGKANRNEIGLATGVGVQTKSGLLIGLRYTGSFTELAKTNYHNNELENARFSVFQASVGYLLKLK